MGHFQWICCIIVVRLVIHLDLAEQKVIGVQTFFNVHLTKLQFYNKTIYVAGLGRLYKLDEDLNILYSTGTCVDKTAACDNVNQIMLVNEDTEELILCGTGNGGKCEKRSLGDISNVTRAGSDTLEVSTDEKRPVHGFIMSDGNMMIGVTYGSGLKEVPSHLVGIRGISFDYAISTRSLLNFEVYKRLTLGIHKTDGQSDIPTEKQVASLEDYKIYFKGGFQHNGFSYFTTIQKNFVGYDIYVSKLVRICQNDTSDDYTSYADINISCQKDGVVYNLIQHVILVDKPDNKGTLFIASFSVGNDPESTPGDNAICVTKLADLDKAIMAAKKEFIVCPKSNRSEIERYLPNELPYQEGCLADESLYSEANVTCVVVFTTFRYVIGETPFTMAAVYTLASDKGDITTMYSGVVDGVKVDIHVGTSSGSIIKLNYLGVDKDLELYETQYVPPGFPVRAIAQKNDNYFVMTSQKLLKYSNTNCSEYTTCAETMVGRNPLCGWCVYKQRSSRITDCSSELNHWLSSHGDCVTFSLDTKGLPINAEPKQIQLTVNNFPSKQDEDEYKCIYKNGATIIGITTASGIDNHINCSSPTVASYTEATLELWVHYVFLASSPFLFYACGHYNKCGECTNTIGSDCQWCLQNNRCVSPGQCNHSAGVSLTQKSQCPKLVENPSQFVHNGVVTSVTFHAENLPVHASDFFLTIPAIPSFQLVKASGTAIQTSVTFSIQITSNERLKNYPVIIKYGLKGQGENSSVMLNDDFNNNVTVYTCSKMASDCSRCNALNKTRYSCNWCGGAPAVCGHYESGCTPTTTCPAPVVTKIVPRDGPIQGHTRVTISGTDLGSSLSNISSVTLAGVSCDVTEVVADRDSTDFDTMVTNEIHCTSGAQSCMSAVGVPGDVIVTSGGKQSPISDSIAFTYQIMTITDILPNKGPIAGGTRITIYGEHLGVGNRELIVLFGIAAINDVEVLPKSDLDAVVTGSYFTVQVVVPSGLKTNVTNVKLYLPNFAFPPVAEKSLNFTLLPNPMFDPIRPKKGFLSGGTLKTLTGRRLDNANIATMKTIYAGSFSKVKCTIKSATEVVCPVPRAPNNVCDNCGLISRTAHVALDGIQISVIITYTSDPNIKMFGNGETDNVVEFDPSKIKLIITGEKLNLAATISDFTVTVGIENCTMVELTDTKLVCIPPIKQPQPGIPGAEYPEVNVTVGNIHKTVGFLRYKKTFIITVVISVLIVLVALGITTACFLYRKFRSKVKKLESISAAKDLKLSSIEGRLQESEARNNEYVTQSTNVDDPYAYIDDPYHEIDTDKTANTCQVLDATTRTVGYTEAVLRESGYIHPQSTSRSSDQGQPDNEHGNDGYIHPQSELENFYYEHPQATSKSSDQVQPNDESGKDGYIHPQWEQKNFVYEHPQATSRSSDQGQPDDESGKDGYIHPQSEQKNFDYEQPQGRPPIYLQLQGDSSDSSYEDTDALRA